MILLNFPWTLHSVSAQALIFVGRHLLYGARTESLVGIFTVVLDRPCLVASAEPHCHLLQTSSKQQRKTCQILWDAFVLQNTRQTAINQHLLKLILTRSLTFKAITGHTAFLNVYMKCSLQEREQH